MSFSKLLITHQLNADVNGRIRLEFPIDIEQVAALQF